MAYENLSLNEKLNYMNSDSPSGNLQFRMVSTSSEPLKMPTERTTKKTKVFIELDE